MSKKLKVLHVVGGMDIGGTETMIMNLYREVHNDMRFDFISYYNHDGYYDKEIRELGGKVIKINPPSKLNIIKSIKDLYKVIKEEGPYDVVHAHTLFNCGIAMIASKFAGVDKRISHSHTNLKVNSPIKQIYFSIMRIIIRIFSTDYLACSLDSAKYLFGRNIISNKNYKTLPNYIDYKKYLYCNDSNTIREELEIMDNEILVGHVGRFVDVKNHKFLIEVLNEMIKINKNVRAVLVGEGVLKEHIKKYVKEFGIEDKVKFLGIRDDIEKVLNNMDLFIFPSIYEGLGLVMIEAQASGLPCLVSEAIQPEADLEIGFVKKIDLEKGAEVWAKEALKLIGNKNKDNKLILKGIENKGYDLNNIVNTLLDVYKVNSRQENFNEKGFNI